MLNDDVTFYYGTAVRLIGWISLMNHQELCAFISKLERVWGVDVEEQKLLDAMIAYARTQIDDG
ncbi:hypothetical protein ACUN0C_18770 [Faunimonas sp. B44]|uniref:hypothetical protein n=1 Tax=Faunimonas sp. B44 TaxID=3461493 RepID=UPI004044E205